MTEDPSLYQYNEPKTWTEVRDLIQNVAADIASGKELFFLDKISDLEKAALMDNISDIKYEKGTCLSGSDDSCAGVFLIRSGTHRVYMLSEDGKDLTTFSSETRRNLYPLSVHAYQADTFEVFDRG
jgi:hypothetical protein